MLKNYFITAINNLLKNKLYSAINIIGLAVGLAAFLLITLYVRNELSYDRHWEKADLIYRIDYALLDADALLLITEWNEFRVLNYELIERLLTHKLIFDGRNIYEPAEMKENGFAYFSIGRPDVG